MSNPIAHALKKNPKAANAPTTVQYTNLQLAYDYFNRTLFDGQLTDCILVFGRDMKNCFGYFHAKQWENTEEQSTCHMISLTPMHLKRGLEAVFATLVHEMVHLWQEDCGEPSKNGYHNKEWANKMEEIGLIPSSTGEPGGKRTGSKCSHYILEGGPFYHAFRDMPEFIRLPWIGAGLSEKKKAKRNKVTYQCLGCEAKCWGKPEMTIICGDCDEPFTEIG